MQRQQLPLARRRELRCRQPVLGELSEKQKLSKQKTGKPLVITCFVLTAFPKKYKSFGETEIINILKKNYG